MTRPRLIALLFIVYVVSIHLQSELSSQAFPPKRPPEELLRLSLAAEKPGLAEPFKGITTNGQIEPGLFAIRSTGVSTAASAQQPVVQKTALVTVVAEARGPAANLGPRDFVVREDRATRDVLDVRPATEPLFIALLIDTIRPPAGVLAPTQDFRRGLAAFVSTIKGGNPDAQIAILDYAGATVTAIDFTSEAHTLDRYIQQLFPSRQADAVLIDAVVEGARKLGDKPSPRRAIVVVDFNSRDSSAVTAMQQAAETVNKSGATVWTVSVRSTSASSSHREDVLNVVTRSSGGTRLTIVEPTGLEATLKSVANSLLSQYTVTFARPANATVKSTQMETARGGKVLLTPWMR